jgi:hypothetical protein
MRAIIGGALMALTIASTNAAEDRNNAKDILPGCKEYDLLYCMGQINGIAHMLIRNSYMTVYRAVDCAEIPQNITNKELAQAIIRYD